MSKQRIRKGGVRSRRQRYLDGGGGVEQVLQAEVAAVLQVVLAELLNELEVGQALSHSHGLLQTHIWGGEQEPSDRNTTLRSIASP